MDVVQGSEKQVGEEPSLLSVRTTAFTNAPHKLQVHMRPKAIQEYQKQKHNNYRQASQIQVSNLQLEDASCQLDRSCVDINHPSIGWMPVGPVSESPILLSRRSEGFLRVVDDYMEM